MPADMPVRALTILPVEYGAIDARGKILLAGLFAGLAVPVTPFDVTFAIALELAPAPAGEAAGILRLSGSALGETVDVPFQVPVNDDPAGSVGVLVGPRQVTVNQAGTLVIDVLVHGHEVGQRTLLVRHASGGRQP